MASTTAVFFFMNIYAFTLLNILELLYAVQLSDSIQIPGCREDYIIKPRRRQEDGPTGDAQAFRAENRKNQLQKM
jgi:hypothetical protein